jgi:hypothetical protein
MAFNRKVDMSIGAFGFGLNISNLHIDFKIQKSLKIHENTAEFTIYNMTEDTANRVLIVGNNVIFKAGYEDEAVSTIYHGNIVQVLSGHSVTDRVAKIKCMSNRSTNQKLIKKNVSISYIKGTMVAVPLNEIAVLLNLTVFGLQNAQIQLPNGWVYVGSTNGALRYLQDVLDSQGVGVYIDNNEMVVYNIGEVSFFDIVYLTYTGGLLRVKDITLPEEPLLQKAKRKTKKDTRKKLAFESLLIPQLKINAPVIVKTDDPAIDGTYVLEKLVFQGDNYGGDFMAKGELVE